MATRFSFLLRRDISRRRHSSAILAHVASAFRGLDAAEISLITSVGVWIRAFANPFIAHFADRSGAHRMIIMISASGVITYALFGIADGFWMLFVVNIMASAMFMALIPLGENLASRASVEHGFDYGRVRLWKSITFILAAYAGGWMVEKTGDAAILWMIVTAMIAAFIAGFDRTETSRPRSRIGAACPVSAFALMRQKKTWCSLLHRLAAIDHAVLYVFGAIHWRAAGISDDVIGALWAEGVIAEIVLFAFSGAVVAAAEPIRPDVIAAGTTGIVRWAILAGTADVVLFATQWLRPDLRGCPSGSHAAYASDRARHMSASAQSLYSGFAIRALMGLAAW